MKKCREILGEEITRCGGQTTLVENYPEPLQIKETDVLIDCFEDRVCRWIFKPAKILLAQKLEKKPGEKDPDVDFAVLTILNAIPEMLAQFQGHQSNKRNTEYLYKQGLLYIFPKLKNHPHEESIATLLYHKLRNAIAHMGLTDPGIILERETKCPITLCCGNGDKLVVIINVPKWYKQTEKRVDDYLNELRDDSNKNLRCKFRERMEKDELKNHPLCLCGKNPS